MKTAKEYRAESKAALSGQWGMAILTYVIYGCIVGALSSTGIGSILLGGALMCGMAYVMTGIYRGRRIQIGDLFAGFSIPSFVATIGLYVKMIIFIFLWSMLFVIPGIVKAYSYAMAPYIMMDHPEMTGGEAITASKQLMAGKKWSLFCLQLSFIGWILLCILTLGILTLWVAPWMEAANAAFYESIKYEVPGYEEPGYEEPTYEEPIVY